jgi:xanthine dehydrogenase YagS FAD-binding subunit
VIGNNYYHSIFGGPKGCYAVYPSDLATALVALNATIITNTRTIPIEGFFDSLTGTVLEVGEIVTEIDIPAPASGTKQTFSKAALTKDVEFSMVSVATMVTVSGTTCTAARIAFGGVAPTPLRSTAAENSIVGSAIGPTTAAAAATAAMASATPLQYNAYKVQLAKGLLVQALQA